MKYLIILTIRPSNDFEFFADIIMVWSAIVVLSTLVIALILITRQHQKRLEAQRTEERIRQNLTGCDLYFLIKEKKVVDANNCEIPVVNEFPCELAPILSFKRLPDRALKVSFESIRIAKNDTLILIMKPCEDEMLFQADVITTDFINLTHPIMGSIKLPAPRKHVIKEQMLTVCQCVKKSVNSYLAFCRIRN